MSAERVYLLIEDSYEDGEYQVVAAYTDEALSKQAESLTGRQIVVVPISNRVPEKHRIYHRHWKAARCGQPTNGYTCDVNDIPIHGGSCRCLPEERKEWVEEIWDFGPSGVDESTTEINVPGGVTVSGLDEKNVAATFDYLVRQNPGIPEPPKPPIDPNRPQLPPLVKRPGQTGIASNPSRERSGGSTKLKFGG